MVLKPQGQRLDGKAFKASIGLVGLAGRFNVEMGGVERSEDSTDVYTLRSDTFPATKTIKFINKGDFAAFIRVSSESVSLNEEEVGLTAGMRGPVLMHTYIATGANATAPPPKQTGQGPNPYEHPSAPVSLRL